MAQAKSATVQRWNDEHPSRRKYITYRSMCKSFIMKYAKPEDVDKMAEWLAVRKQRDMRIEKGYKG